MRQLFLEKGTVRARTVFEPLLEKGCILVAVRFSSISPGTEAATINASETASLFKQLPQKITRVLESITQNGVESTRALIKARLQGPIIPLGYSCSGVVIGVGPEVTTFRVGDLVACAGPGIANHADVVNVPINLAVKLKDDSRLPQASFCALGAIALQAIRRAQLQLGEYVCIIGLGVIGQITAQLARISGCTVIAIDTNQDRVTTAQILGAHHALCANEETIINIQAITDRYGVDCTFVTAADNSNKVLTAAINATRKKGKVVIVGDVGMNLNREELYKKEIDLLISCSYGPGRYDSSYEQKGHDYPYPYVRWTEQRNMTAFIKLLESDQIDVTGLITHTIPLESAQDAYTALKNKHALGVVFEYEPRMPVPHIEKPRFTPAHTTSVRVGFIGAGGFAKLKLMPIISRLKAVNISAIVDTDQANSINMSRLYGSARALTHESQLFEGIDLVDAVVISSPHTYHCAQAITALRHGKAVFLEKPMVTTFAQLEELQAVLDENPDIPFCVDYNRSFAPFVQQIKQQIKTRRSPLIISYRVNAGFIPKDHWVQTEVGAGRIIGEACHIIDLFHYLTDATARSVSVEAIAPHSDSLFPTDNFCAQISFSDGSICSLVYTALGHPSIGKEKMEIFYDSKTIILDDYTTLSGFGVPSSFNQQSPTQDKGHEALVRAFFGSLRSPKRTELISRKRLYEVAKVTLVIDKLACAGGGEMAFNEAETHHIIEPTSRVNDLHGG